MEQTNLPEEVDFPYVDPDTGEIRDDLAAITSEDLPVLARQIKAIDRRATMVKKYGDDEIDRIDAIINDKVSKLNKSREFLLARAKGLMDAIGQSKLPYPALGTFRYRKLPVSLDDSDYKDMSDEVRANVQLAHKDFFVTKTTVAPMKREILSFIKKGDPVPGFALLEKEPVFEFKAEV